jgi:uncharacterized protein (TIGR00369 family)
MPSTTPSDIGAALGVDDGTDLTEIIIRLEQFLAFNRLLGLEFTGMTAEKATFEFAERPEPIGNPQRQALHGGVISAALDTAGGMVAMAALVERADSTEEALASLMKVGTIDMRVDYLRPATADRFVATSHLQRLGHTVAVTRMELHDDRGTLVAVGTGTYIVG